MLPAYWLLQLWTVRLEPYGQAAVLAGFVAAWAVCGSLLSSAVKIGLLLAGVPFGRADEPAELLERTRRDLSGGRIAEDEGRARAAACLVALGRFDEALAECEAAEAAGAREASAARRGQVRFLRARALEGAGRRGEAAPLYRKIAGDETLGRPLRIAARLRAGTDSDLTADLAALGAAPADAGRPRGAACCGAPAGCRGDWSPDEVAFLCDTVAELLRSGADRSALAEASAVLAERIPPGRLRRRMERAAG